MTSADFPASGVYIARTGDDAVLPFEVKPLGVRGRVVRLPAPSMTLSVATAIRAPFRLCLRKPWR
ncbi:hypothetical protein [Rhodoligotrophos ferricapiens]|uniref:hypothetical protein n=1 Tax=Rhodoligotrophos ferricapiens TaxID=3069264 RepID=UPI00315CDBA2